MNILNVVNHFRYFLDKILFVTFRKSKNLRVLKDAWRGEPVIIVGNGPSLKKTPLDKFSSFKSIGMNKINLLFKSTDWRPTLITCVNRHVISQNRSFFLSTSIPVFIAWQNRFFLRRRKSDNIEFFFNSNKVHFSRELHNTAGAGATVTFTALQLAHYLGADPVILVGVDHSFSTVGSPHETQVRKGDDPNHFHPDYFASGVKWNLPDLDTSEVAYKLAHDEFQRDGRRIFDATVGGKLRIFPKISVDDALSILKGDQ